MIVIDRTNEVEQEIVITADEVRNDSVLYLKHDETRNTYTILLGVNTSPFKERYDRFFVPTEDFNAMPEGMYSYTVKELPNQVNFQVGKLYIKPQFTSEAIPSAENTDNDILVFTK